MSMHIHLCFTVFFKVMVDVCSTSLLFVVNEMRDRVSLCLCVVYMPLILNG